MIRTALPTAAITASAGAALLAGAGTTLAPEPAVLNGGLSTGATAAAHYQHSNDSTNVIHWPGAWTAGGNAPAGTPCSTYPMAAAPQTTRVIWVSPSGTHRKCL